MSIEVMKQAMEALEQIAGATPFPAGRHAIAALRQAIADQESYRDAYPNNFDMYETAPLETQPPNPYKRADLCDKEG